MHEATSMWSFLTACKLCEVRNLVTFAVIPPVPETAWLIVGAQYILFNEWLGEGVRKGSELGRVQCTLCTPCSWFLDWPFQESRSWLEDRSIHAVGSYMLGHHPCQCCARSWRWNDLKDFIQGHLQYLDNCGFSFSTVAVAKAISQNDFFPKYWHDLWVQGIGWTCDR